jgi:hypothetical protein
MFVKLMKQDVRATARLMLPVYLAALILAVFVRIATSLPDSVQSTTFGSLFTGVTMALYSAASLAVVVMSFILMIWRFRKNYMTDEGYLMFTLPATTGELIWSKLIVALVWSVVTFLAVAAALALAVTVIPDLDLSGLREMLRALLSPLSTGDLVAYAAEGVVTALFNALRTLLMFYAAIALGHSFANHKIFLSVVFYLAFSVALQTLASFGGIYGIIAAGENGFFSGDPLVWGHRLSLSAVFATLIIAVVFYVVTHLMLKRRLNLQ